MEGEKSNSKRENIQHIPFKIKSKKQNSKQITACQYIYLRSRKKIGKLNDIR